MKLSEFLNKHEQRQLLKLLPDVDFNKDMTDDEVLEVDDRVQDILQFYGFTENAELTDLGKIAEPLVDKFGSL